MKAFSKLICFLQGFAIGFAVASYIGLANAASTFAPPIKNKEAATFAPPIKNKEAEVTTAVSSSSPSPSPISLDGLAIVPIQSYNACKNKVQHLTCLKTIAWKSKSTLSSADLMLIPLPEAPDLIKSKLCETLPETPRSHVMACIQTPEKLGVLVYPDNNNMSSFRHVFPTEVKEIANVLQQQQQQQHAVHPDDNVQKDVVKVDVIDRKSILMKQTYLPSSKWSDDLRATDGNAGNFIWMYGATRLLNPATNFFLPNPEEDIDKAEAWVLAFPNYLDVQNNDKYPNTAKSRSRWVKQAKNPTVVLGIGMQADIRNKTDAMNFTFFDNHRQMLVDIAEWMDKPRIGTRGEFTTKTCENSGIYNKCISMGCPSLTINRELNLGKVLENKWEKVLQKLTSTNYDEQNIKIAVAMPATNLKLGKDRRGALMQFINILHNNFNVSFVFQDGGDTMLIKKHIVEKEKVNMHRFYNVETWFETLKRYDLVISGRIHGGMAGIGAGVPTVIVPTDIRIMELVEAMHLPYLNLDQIFDHMKKNKNKKNTSFKLDEILLSASQTNFHAFEVNRRDKISKWKEMIEDTGLSVDQRFDQILESPL